MQVAERPMVTDWPSTASSVPASGPATTRSVAAGGRLVAGRSSQSPPTVVTVTTAPCRRPQVPRAWLAGHGRPSVVGASSGGSARS